MPPIRGVDGRTTSTLLTSSCSGTTPARGLPAHATRCTGYREWNSNPRILCSRCGGPTTKQTRLQRVVPDYAQTTYHRRSRIRIPRKRIQTTRFRSQHLQAHHRATSKENAAAAAQMQKCKPNTLLSLQFLSTRKTRGGMQRSSETSEYEGTDTQDVYQACCQKRGNQQATR